MATIYVNDRPYEVADGQSLLAACLSLGFDVPYFCWHPAMHSVGSCRMCAVKLFRDDKDSRGHIVMSCTTAASHGVRISIDDPEVKEFRAGVIEFLMLNHPHDCPICDEGGECHLQDVTVMTGHVYRENRFKKRTFRNQYLGPFLEHEMNRCIQCYRCVRFYRDYAGGRDLNVFGVHNRIYFGRARDGILESEFSGNLAEVCPTGVFTDKTAKRHYARPWDLQTAPSICVHCSLGCNTIPADRYGSLRRVRNRYNGEVNGYFLCDRGRFGYEFVNSGKRIRQPMLRQKDGYGEAALLPASGESVLQNLQRVFRDSVGVIGIGSPRASLEANFALRKLVGEDRFFSGMSDSDHNLVGLILDIVGNGPVRTPSLREMESADAVLILGEDLNNTAPMAVLSIHQTVHHRTMEAARKLRIPRWDDMAFRLIASGDKWPIFLGTPAGTRLDNIAAESFHAAPQDIARIGFAVAHELLADSPLPPDISNESLDLARNIADVLKAAARPLIVSGTGCGSDAVIKAAANVAWALCRNNPGTRLSYIVPECNSMGSALMGGGTLTAALECIQHGEADSAIIVENDLYRRKDPLWVKTFLSSCKNVVVLDHLLTQTALEADAILPAGTFADSDGTLVNNEGRCQRYFQVIGPRGEIRESWQLLRDIMLATGRGDASHWRSLDDVIAEMAVAVPGLAKVAEAAPPATFRAQGMKIPRQSHRFSGRTSMRADVNVHEKMPPDDIDTPLAFSMEGYHGQPPAALIPRYWAPLWNSVQALNKFQSEISGPLRGGDPGVRLLEPSAVATQTFFEDIPEAFQRRDGDWLIVPLFHVFGSEELSIIAPGIEEQAPKPYLGLNPEDVRGLRVEEGEEIEMVSGTFSQVIAVRLFPTLPAGVAGLPAGLPGISALDLPAWGQVRRIRRAER